MTHSPDIFEVARAIKLVQSMELKARRDETGDDGRRFASLASVMKVLRLPWDTAKLAVVQWCGASEIETTITHLASGQFMSVRTNCEMRADGGRGYGPRHALMMAFNVVEQAEKKTKKVKAGTAWAAGTWGTVPQRVYDAFVAVGLNSAQMSIIAKSGQSEDAMIADAQRLGGRK